MDAQQRAMEKKGYVLGVVGSIRGREKERFPGQPGMSACPPCQGSLCFADSSTPTDTLVSERAGG